FARHLCGAQSLLVRQCSGRAGLHALATERTRGLLEFAIELRRDLSRETAVHYADGVIALLFGAHAHAAITRDAEIVIPQNERIVVGLVARAGFLSFESSGARVVAVHERGECLRSKP